MHFPRILSAAAVSSALASMCSPALAQSTEQSLPPVVVTATPFNAPEDAQILLPATVLSGTELRNKLEPSLGNTLVRELGVSSTAFGAGASRPVIRGLAGPRVRILQNGMSVLDASSLSDDHAVAVETHTARQIEILRGPAALLYGSGAIGGVVNVVNDRIPTMLAPKPTGEAEVRFGSVDSEKSVSFSVDGASGPIALHLDGNLRDSDNYKIPGFAVLDDPDSAQGRLPSSYTRAKSLGLGASHVGSWGHIGASVGVQNDRYGIPTEEQSFITLSQTRLDADALVRQPLAGFESFRVRLGNTDYKHTENLQDGTPATDFKNRAFETRWELTHKPLAGWRGTLGIQTENSRYSALAADGSGPETVPITRSKSVAGFLVEERDFGPVRASAGARLESVKRRPDASAGLPDRDFNLGSYSIGGLWTFAPGYSFGPTLSIAQRAPATEELYANGPHESTRTFDIGDADLRKETSRNLELTLQKTNGLMRWQANLFRNKVQNFVYGRTDGSLVNDDGDLDPDGEFRQRFWTQGDATIRGAEMEVSYNLRGEGLSLRAFADTSRGRLDGADSLPLQPATRFGIDADFKQGPWRTGVGLLRAREQNRLASFETTPTPGYTRLDAHLSYTQRVGTTQWTGFVLARNLLNQDIRLSTSVLKDEVPLAGRNLIVGVRARF
jgi:iron complex outermembrane receptor protein